MSEKTEKLISFFNEMNLAFDCKTDDESVIVQFQVRAKPGSKLDKVRLQGEIIEVFVTTPPVEGKANKAIMKLLSSAFGVAASKIELSRGTQGKNKSFVMTFSFGSGRDVEYYKDRISKRIQID